ncbi:MAG: glycosyltransferase family 39 protein [Bryobacteraceae bacterium]|nr:glycosyltransferase family 39 protein [Bryobacteraceae bacterium]
MSPPAILFGAAFTGATSLSLGLLLLRRLGLRPRAGEVFPIGFLLGSAALNLAVFLSLTFWVAGPGWFAVLGAGAIGACLFTRAWRIPTDPSPVVPTLWRRILGVSLLVYGTFTFFHAMAPEISPDGVAYHLGTVGRYFRNGGFDWYTTDMYANLPMGVEMLFLFAYSFGRHSAAALVHWQFLMVLPFVVLAIGRRFDLPKTGAIAALLTFLSPVVLLDGASAYVDVATGAVIAGLFLALCAFEQDTEHQPWLIVSGLLAGFCYAVKLTAAPAVPFALLFVAWSLRRSPWKITARAVVITGALATLLIAPWLIKNTLMVGNPFSPFLNRYFPNPYVRISFEDMYREMHRNYYGAVPHWSMIPVEVAVLGGKLNGYLGPLFLIAPLGLLALRWPLGRRAWIAALFFASTYPSNIGTRFLISVLPFVSLALAMLFERWRMGLAVIAFHFVAASPEVGKGYADPYAWRLDRFRWTQAWRIEAEDTWLARMLPDYRMSRLVETHVPLHGRVLTYAGVAQAYTSRQIDVSYQAGRNNAAAEMFAAGVAADIVAMYSQTFRFPAIPAQRVRLVQTATTPQNWSVSELRVQAPGGREYDRQQWWRLQAKPNPWDVQWAFDDCPVTRWKAWDKSTPGQYLEINFIRPMELGGIRADISGDQPDVTMRIDVDTGDGVWKTVSDKPEDTALEPPPNVRRKVVDDLKRLGYTHLVVAKNEFLASDVYRNEAAWGITRIGDTGEGRLYRLD